VTSAASNSADACLIDTNVLLRSVEVGHSMHAVARQAIQQMVGAGTVLHVSSQNLIEFWVAATRPLAVNGLGLSPAQAAAEIANFLAAFQLLPDTSSIFPEWQRIVALYRVSGKNAHDARLVALMRVNVIVRILTFNIGDFSRYAGEGIAVVDPALAALAVP
jgi:predicted nucleic acid-binding protein